MKRYRCQGIRNPKTDHINSLIIAQYSIDLWHRTKQQIDRTQERQELRLLDDFNRYNGKDKLVTLFLTIGIVIILQRVQRKYLLRSILTG